MRGAGLIERIQLRDCCDPGYSGDYPMLWASENGYMNVKAVLAGVTNSSKLARPKVPTLVGVLAQVTENVSLLEQQTHRVGQRELFVESRHLFARSREQPGQALADKTGNIVAVQVVVANGFKVG
jgi:hypothetical protein